MLFSMFVQRVKAYKQKGFKLMIISIIIIPLRSNLESDIS